MAVIILESFVVAVTNLEFVQVSFL